MIPSATFRAVRLRLGVTQGDVACAGRADQSSVSMLERGVLRRDCETAVRIRRGLVVCWRRSKDRQRREVLRASFAAHRAVWAAQWLPSLSARRSLEEAALQLDRWSDHDTADWLLAARPAWIVEVCAGVAAHALRRFPPSESGGVLHPWDILAEAGLVDIDRATELFEFGDGEEFGGVLTWSPRPEWLLQPLPCL